MCGRSVSNLRRETGKEYVVKGEVIHRNRRAGRTYRRRVEAAVVRPVNFPVSDVAASSESALPRQLEPKFAVFQSGN